MGDFWPETPPPTKNFWSEILLSPSPANFLKFEFRLMVRNFMQP
jgi:hypothetical protein